MKMIGLSISSVLDFYSRFALPHIRCCTVENYTGRFSSLVPMGCLIKNKGIVFVTCGDHE